MPISNGRRPNYIKTWRSLSTAQSRRTRGRLKSPAGIPGIGMVDRRFMRVPVLTAIRNASGRMPVQPVAYRLFHARFRW